MMNLLSRSLPALRLKLDAYKVSLFHLSILAFLLVFALRNAWSQKWISDDGYIYLIYVKNLLEHGELTYNLGVYVDGSTSFLWPLLIAATHTLAALLHDFTLQQTTILLSIVIYAAFLFQLFALETERSRLALPIATIFASSAYVFSSFATSGLETPLTMLWVVLLIRIALADSPQRIFYGFIVGAAPFVRPELFIFSILLLGREAWNLRTMRRPFVLLMSSVTFGLAIAAARYAVYGDIVPNTFYAKSGGVNSVIWAVRYLKDFSSVYRLEYFLAFSIPAVALLLMTSEKRIRYAAILIFVATYLCAMFATGGDFMHGRFMIPVMPPLLLLVSRAISANFTLGKVSLPVRGTVIAASTLLSALAFASYETPQRTFDAGFRGVDDESFGYFSRNPNLYKWDAPNLHPWAEEGIRLNKLQNLLGEPIGAAAGGIGQIGFYRDASKVFILDRLGLVHPVTSAIDMGGYDRRIGHNRITPNVLIYADPRVTFYSTSEDGLNDILRFRYDGQYFIPIDTSMLPRIVAAGLLPANTMARVDSYILDYLERNVLDTNFLYFLYLRYEGSAEVRAQIERVFESLKQESTWWRWMDRHGELIQSLYDRSREGFGQAPLRLDILAEYGSMHPVPMIYHSKAIAANGQRCRMTQAPLAGEFMKAQKTLGIEMFAHSEAGEFEVRNETERNLFLSASASIDPAASNYLRFIPGKSTDAALGYFYLAAFDESGNEISKERLYWTNSTDMVLPKAASITVSVKVPAQSSLVIKELGIRTALCHPAPEA